MIPLLTLCTLLSGCRSDPQVDGQQGRPTIPVIAAAPIIKDVTLYIEAVGTLQASVSMDIKPQVNGTIEKVFVKEGQPVRRGTALFEIDASLYESKVKEAQAQLSMDRASFAVAQKKMERFRSLAEKDLIAQTEWDDLETQVEKAKASIELDEARLKAARLDLDHCTLCSPVDGRIGKLDVNPGLLVASGQATPLATIVKMDPLTIEFNITEKEYAKISASENGWQQQIELYSLCSSGLCRTGEVTFLDNTFDQKTGLLLIRGYVTNTDQQLRPGQTIRVKMPISVVKDAKLIPQKAIRYNQQGPYVYIVQDDNTVTIRQILLGEEQGSHQMVTQGIDSGERIIIDGHLRLSPGAKVDVKS